MWVQVDTEGTLVNMDNVVYIEKEDGNALRLSYISGDTSKLVVKNIDDRAEAYGVISKLLLGDRHE